MNSAGAKAILKKCDDVSATLKSLSHPVRLKVLCHLLDRERTVGELTDFCDISQSAMSQFLIRMKSEGVIESRREKTFVYYRVADPKILKLMQVIKELYC